MKRLTTSLRSYVPLMIGFGWIILVGDSVVIGLRALGVDKPVAIYLAVIVVTVGIHVAFRRMQRRAGEPTRGDEDVAGDAG